MPTIGPWNMVVGAVVKKQSVLAAARIAGRHCETDPDGCCTPSYRNCANSLNVGSHYVEFDLPAINNAGEVGFLLVHRSIIDGPPAVPDLDTITGWELIETGTEYDEAFARPFSTEITHRVSLYRRVWDGTETALQLPADGGLTSQPAAGGIAISVDPDSATVEQFAWEKLRGSGSFLSPSVFTAPEVTSGGAGRILLYTFSLHDFTEHYFPVEIPAGSICSHDGNYMHGNSFRYSVNAGTPSAFSMTYDGGNNIQQGIAASLLLRS